MARGCPMSGRVTDSSATDLATGAANSLRCSSMPGPPEHTARSGADGMVLPQQPARRLPVSAQEMTSSTGA